MRPGAGAMVGVALVVLACHKGGPAPNAAAAPPVEPTPPPPLCSATEPAAVAACVDAARVEADVRAIAKPRPPGSVHWRNVQSRCADTFDAMGYEVELHRYETGINVIGIKEAAARPDEFVVVGGHYDHIPGCPGADDNATGTAAVLELARVLAGGEYERSLVVACWDEEERGLIGSDAWAAEHAAGGAVSLYINFDSIGFTNDEPGSQAIPTGFDVLFGDETKRLAEQENKADFIAVIADGAARRFADVFASQADALGLKHAVLEIPKLLLVAPLAVDLRRSDHASFWAHDVPALMLTDTANFRSDAYHCRGRPDTVDTLDLPFTVDVIRSAAATAAFALAAPAQDPLHDASDAG